MIFNSPPNEKYRCTIKKQRNIDGLSAFASSTCSLRILLRPTCFRLLIAGESRVSTLQFELKNYQFKIKVEIVQWNSSIMQNIQSKEKNVLSETLNASAYVERIL